MPTIPVWALGRNVAGPAVLTPQTISAAGVLADTTPAQPLVGLWKNISVDAKKTTEEISASDQVRENEVSVSTGTRFEVDMILPNVQTTAQDPIQAVFGSGVPEYFKWVVKFGSTSHVFTGYGLLDECSVKAEGKGAVMVHLHFAMVDPGGLNPEITPLA